MNKVEIKYEKQEYQEECIKNIIKVLKDFDFNKKDNLSTCLEDFYKNHPELNFGKSSGTNLDILMETGTGKTFTYINAIFEINKIYNKNKFIIFLPRRAILEGVRQNIELTRSYFYNIYQKHLKLYEYEDKKSLGRIISHFIGNENEFSVLILTSSAIDKKNDNILHKNHERLFCNKTIFEKIADLNPICFIDEPHLLKGDKFNESFSELNAIYFRFGATFPKEENHKLSNLIYALDSLSAFRQYLVKQINVHTIVSDSKAPHLLQTKPKKEATFSCYIDGLEQKRKVKIGDDLGTMLNYPKLNGRIITKIEAKKIYLDNGEIIALAEQKYHLDDTQIKELLNLAIDVHFKKERELFKRGIKALSLFFIPNISDFKGENPKIKLEFERLYKQKRNEILKSLSPDDEYFEFLNKDIDKDGKLVVAGGYFSGDKGSKDEKEADGVRLILEEKEKLLSFNTPLRFIFSVWALQEGWDNPNIFTITKLACSSSDTSRHQQVGRGLRLCVNQDGKRLTYNHLKQNESNFYDINRLDVLINSAERDFIQGLQNEISSTSLNQNELSDEMLEKIGLNKKQINHIQSHLEDEGFLKFDDEKNCYIFLKPLSPHLQSDDKIKEILSNSLERFFKAFSTSTNQNSYVNDANKQAQKTGIKKALALEFKALWDAINKETKIKYSSFNEDVLLEKIAKYFDAASIEPSSTTLIIQSFDAKQNKIINQDKKPLSTKPILSQNIEKILADFAKAQDLPLSFVLKAYNKISKKEYFGFDTSKAIKLLATAIKESIHQGLISFVSYEFTQTIITNQKPYSLLFDENGKPQKSLDIHYLGQKCDDTTAPAPHYLYDKVVYDSQIEKDIIAKEFKNEGENEICVFAKLPDFSIPTPYKSYKPDFAYIIKTNSGKKIFFICETKGYDSENDIPEDERKKINYAYKFFTCLQDRLKDIVIKFEKRLNKETLMQTLAKIKDDKCQ